MLRARVREHKYDIMSWEQLLLFNKAPMTAPPSFREKQELYEEFLNIFPTASGYWRMYAEEAMAVNELTLVKAIFSRCLLSCLNVDLWSSYLRFIKSVNQTKGVQGVLEIKQAFEFTLERVGQDINSGSIWLEYINFLQIPSVGTPVYKALFSEERMTEGQEESHRLVILRTAFKRALSVPNYQLDAIWKAYENFEKTGPNRTLARKLLEDARSRYILAKRVFQDKKKKLEEIRLNDLAVPFLEQGNQQQGFQGSQLQLWLDYLEFEKSNPQRLDMQQFTIRVSLAYDQALQCLLYYPEVWMDYARFHMYGGGGGLAAARKVLERARSSLRSCLMLHLMAADLEELEHNVEKAKAIYRELLSEVDKKLSMDGNGISGVEGSLADQAMLLWITYMRFLRRAESIKASREIFVAAALLEWRSKEQQVAVRIFEKGMLLYMGCPEFILEYIKFLLGIGDIENTRAVFERALSVESCQKSQSLWECYVNILYEIGDLVFLQRVEERKRQALADTTTNNLHSILYRYKFLDLYPCAQGSQTGHVKSFLGISKAQLILNSLPTSPLPVPTALPPLSIIQIPFIASQPNQAIGKIPQIGTIPGYYGGEMGRVIAEQQETLKVPQNLSNFLNRLPALEGGEKLLVDPERALKALLTADLSVANRSLKRCRSEIDNETYYSSNLDPTPNVAADEEGKGKKGLFENQMMEPGGGEGDLMDEYRLRMRRKILADQQKQGTASKTVPTSLEPASDVTVS